MCYTTTIVLKSDCAKSRTVTNNWLHTLELKGEHMSNVRRVYVEKKPDFAVKAKELKHVNTLEIQKALIHS